MIIYPSRIKGEEYPLKRGDIVVCITEHFQEFTYGKQYQLYCDFQLPSQSINLCIDCFRCRCLRRLDEFCLRHNYSTLPIDSDLGNQNLPAYYSPTGYYFLPLHIWRELKINKVLEK
jgi:hypothetical protein